MDRICMAVAIVPMAKEFGWAPGVQGIIQSAFLWGYIGTTGLGGSLADKYGGKVVMASSIFWFSLASLLLPLALAGPIGKMGWTLPAVLTARAFVGLGEGASMPAMNNLMATRVPPQQRASAIGTAFTGFHSGNLVGLALSPLLLSRFGWRGIFYVFGILGAPLLAAWWTLVPPDTPRTTTSKASSSGMLQSWRKFLSKKATWAIVAANFVNHWSYFILLNWMPSYFVRALGLDLRASSFLSFLPWIVLAVGSTLAGMLADRLVSGGWSRTRVRKVFQSIAFLTPAAALLILANPSISPRAAVTCLTFALGVTSLGQAGFVANMSDVAPTQAGQMFGLCNTFGSFAGILGTATVGFIVEATGSFDPVFKLTSALCVAATVLWNLWCSGEKVFD
ncbi:hypothetical protein WJX74_005307 [Apatococcus lobatus]|uniref:Major facilitator superfamily (MFS) profile domain-containing protein n=1 Tax=Apatococcus lobatus TaxID=904363 RepID=A0AAW1RDJ0_9CHLO